MKFPFPTLLLLALILLVLFSGNFVLSSLKPRPHRKHHHPSTIPPGGGSGGNGKSNKQQKPIGISGGELVPYGQAKFMAEIYNYKKNSSNEPNFNNKVIGWCSGVVLNEFSILTSGRCCMYFYNNKTDVFVFMGGYRLDQLGFYPHLIRKITELKVHEEFLQKWLEEEDKPHDYDNEIYWEYFLNDFCVMKFNESIKLDDDNYYDAVKPINLPPILPPSPSPSPSPTISIPTSIQSIVSTIENSPIIIDENEIYFNYLNLKNCWLLGYGKEWREGIRNRLNKVTMKFHIIDEEQSSMGSFKEYRMIIANFTNKFKDKNVPDPGLDPRSAMFGDIGGPLICHIDLVGFKKHIRAIRKGRKMKINNNSHDENNNDANMNENFILIGLIHYSTIWLHEQYPTIDYYTKIESIRFALRWIYDQIGGYDDDKYFNLDEDIITSTTTTTDTATDTATDDDDDSSTNSPINEENNHTFLYFLIIFFIIFIIANLAYFFHDFYRKKKCLKNEREKGEAGKLPPTATPTTDANTTAATTTDAAPDATGTNAS